MAVEIDSGICHQKNDLDQTRYNPALRRVWPWPSVLLESVAAWTLALPGGLWLDAACGEGHLGAVPVCPEDINGDGAINVLDLVDLLLCFGQSAVPGCENEDVTGDGSVNVVDLVDLLLEFGNDCP